jgi:hypothetical protein
MDEAACKTLLCFDMTTSAGFHAQLTGILAGLAFASIVVILQSTGFSGRGAEAGLLSFFSALITLLIAAFLYGTAAGEERIAGRAAIMVFLAGVTSAVAVLELLYGLTWLVRAGGFPNATEMTARITALVAPLITFLYLAVTALNEASVTTGREVVGSAVFVFLLLLSFLLVLILVAVQLFWGSSELRQLAIRSASRLGPEPWLSLISIWVGLAAAVTGGIVLQLDPDIAAPHWLIYIVMALWFGFECVMVLLVRAIDIEVASKQTLKLQQRRGSPPRRSLMRWRPCCSSATSSRWRPR